MELFSWFSSGLLNGTKHVIFSYLNSNGSSDSANRLLRDGIGWYGAKYMRISEILTTVKVVLVVMTGVLFFCCGEKEVLEKAGL